MSKYRVTITTKATYTYETEADEDLAAIAEAFDHRYAWWREYDSDVYEVSAQEVER